ncbi:MAG TPA: amidohydrolase family protein [Myxococcota bacterium]|nr:amidohydrolase family protein [Myxococcota bacterium]
MSALSIWAARALLPAGEAARVRVRCAGGRIEAVEEGVEPRSGDVRHENALLAPGLVDLQVNGGDGAAYDAADAAARRRATDFHMRAGTTSLLATLVSAPLDHLESALARLLGDVSPAGPVVGLHLEGPFLVEAKRGAHAAAPLCDPTPGRVGALLDVAQGALRMVTLAPEREGALEATERFARAGAVVAAGHSRATLAEVRAAVERGLSFVTHVGNASDWPARVLDPALGRRVSEPNLVGAFLVEKRLRGSVILDGHHLHPELARALVELRGPDAVALVSDATPAAGLPPGRYKLGGLDAEIREGGLATTGEGLAGSAVTLLDTVRVGVRQAGLSLATALRMASAVPAAVLGLEARKGRIAAGADADLLALGPDVALRAVYRAGEPVAAKPG